MGNVPRKGKDKKEFIGVKEFAKEVGYSGRHITRLINKGEIDAFRSEGRRKWIIPTSEIVRFRGGNAVATEKDKEVTEKKYAAGSLSTMIPMAQRLMAHYDQLSEVATEILGGLSHVQAMGESSFRCYGLENQPGYSSKVLNRKKLIEWLHLNMIATHNQNRTLMNSFQDHMSAEDGKCKNLYKCLEKSPVRFFKLIQKVALRKTFKGKCQICKDWH